MLVTVKAQVLNNVITDGLPYASTINANFYVQLALKQCRGLGR